jgi:hypothetical protein
MPCTRRTPRCRGRLACQAGHDKRLSVDCADGSVHNGLVLANVRMSLMTSQRRLVYGPFWLDAGPSPLLRMVYA